MTIRILLVDDHHIVRHGLKMILESNPELAVVGEASDGREGIEKARELKPDLVILDISMPEMNGFEVARAIRASSSSTAILMLTQHDTSQMAQEALRAGANGYLVKANAPKELFAAIQAVMRGEQFFKTSCSPD